MARSSKPVRGIHILPAIFVPVFFLLWATMGFEQGLRDTGILLAATLVLVPGIVASILVLVAIHELGHLIAGRRAGYLFESIRIGPFRWDSRGHHIDWSFGPPMGLCEMRPPLGMASWREALLFVSGGPLANLAAALLAAIVFGLAGGQANMARPFSSMAAGNAVQLMMLIALWGNGAGFLINLLPVRTGGIRSDGVELLELWRHRAR